MLGKTFRVIVITAIVSIVSDILEFMIIGHKSSKIFDVITGAYLVNCFSYTLAANADTNEKYTKLHPAEKLGLIIVALITLIFARLAWAISDGLSMLMAVKTVVYYIFFIATCFGLGVVYRKYILKRDRPDSTIQHKS